MDPIETIVAIDLAVATLFGRLSEHHPALARELSAALHQLSGQSADTLPPGSSVPDRLRDWATVLAPPTH